MKKLILIFLIFTPIIMQAQVPNWLNQSLYPYKSNYYETPNGKMHYIDEGKGPVILFIHGTPSWSFLYRDQIKALSQNYRCIAVDHLGFGLSDKPKDFNYHPEQLSENLEELIDSLQLKNITMVVHDFGGPIGLPYAIKNHQNIERLILFNTWLWSTAENDDVKKIDKIVNTFIGRFLYLHLNFSAGYLLKNAFHDKSELSKEAKKHYKKVFPSKNERYGPYKIAQQLKGASDFYASQWNKINALEGIPMLLLWGMKDDFIKPTYLEKWKEKFPKAKSIELNTGHFPQEEKPNEVTKKMVQFLDNN